MLFLIFVITLATLILNAAASPAPVLQARQCVQTVTVNAFGTPPAGGVPTAVPPGINVIPRNEMGKRHNQVATPVANAPCAVVTVVNIHA